MKANECCCPDGIKNLGRPAISNTISKTMWRELERLKAENPEVFNKIMSERKSLLGLDYSDCTITYNPDKE